MYLYETHLHTSPVSKCAKATVAETLAFYKEKGYDGVFLTNHFLDGNIGIPKDLPVKEQLDFYFSDYEEALRIGKEIGLKVFLGVESSYGGTDFLIYGLQKDFYYAHPEILELSKDKVRQLALYREGGAFVIQAHPFREANYIDHIRLYPRSVDGIEVINAGRTDLENRMARIYAEEYGLFMSAGTDNHTAGEAKILAGIRTGEPIDTEADFIRLMKEGKTEVFRSENP